MFKVYALYSPEHDKIYIGYTADLDRRFIEHNTSNKGHTKKYRPWILVYFEDCDSKENAILREKQLKSGGGRNFIKQQIKIQFPEAFGRGIRRQAEQHS